MAVTSNRWIPFGVLIGLGLGCSQPQPLPPGKDGGQLGWDGGQPVELVDAGATVTVNLLAPLDAGTAVYDPGATAYHWRDAWGAALPLSRPHREAFAATGSGGVVLLDVRWPGQDLLTAPSDAQFQAECEALYGAALTELLGQGRTVLLEVAGPPRWASSRPNDTGPVQPGVNNRAIWSVAPPDPSNAFDRWSHAWGQLGAFLKHRHPQELSLGRLWVSYLSEPNYETFYGPISDAVAAYRSGATALKAIDARFRVGGITPSNPWANKTSPAAFATTAPVLLTWLEGCQAAACPIDFVTTHFFTAGPSRWAAEGSAFDDAAAAMRAWLSRTGYAGAGLVVTDWTTWEFNDSGQGRVPNNSWLSSEHDTEYRAAHLAAGQIALRRAGFSAHTLGTLFEQANVPGEFIGDWGLVTNAGLAKPALNALAATSRLAGTSLREVEVSGDAAAERFLFAEAGVGQGTLAVIVTRFVPDTREGKKGHFMLVKQLAYRLAARGITPTDLCRQGLCTEAELLAMIVSHSTASAPGLEPGLRELFEQWFALDAAAAQAPLRETVVLKLLGLPPAASEVRHFRVSAKSSNAFNHCVREANDCADIDAVNAQFGHLEQVGAQPTGGAATLTLTFEQEQHQVDLFVATGL